MVSHCSLHLIINDLCDLQKLLGFNFHVIVPLSNEGRYTCHSSSESERDPSARSPAQK